MRYSILLLFIISVVFPIASYSQKVIPVKPGSALMDGSFIVAYTNKWKVVVENADGSSQDALIWTDYAQLMTVDGKKYLHRVQDLYSPSYNLVDTWINMVEHKTLKPWQFQAVNPEGSVSFLEFLEKSIVSNSNRNQNIDMKMDTVDISNSLFDWNLYGMLLVGLPFEIGSTYALPVWLPGSDQEGTVKATRESKKTISTLSNETIETVKVSTDKGLTFWLTKKAPYVIQLQLDQQNGARRMWYMF